MAVEQAVVDRRRSAGRFEYPENPFAIRGIDHTAMNVRDPVRSVRFYAATLGAVVYHSIGFDPAEEARGRVRHVFMHVGRTLLQTGYPHDGITFTDARNRSGWPQWAFEVPAAHLHGNVADLRARGIPVHGPERHHGRTSAYFQDVDGNKLELVCWEDGAGAGVPSVEHVTVDWPSLAHDWQPSGDEAFPVGDVKPPRGTRFRIPANARGIRGVDHVALPVRDVELSASFYAEILGASPFTGAGVAGEGGAGGDGSHMFLHVGDTLVGLGRPHDGTSFPDPQNVSGWPHFAFEIPASAMDRAVERLRSCDLPFNGPIHHGDPTHPNLYFQDPDGNKLELCVGRGFYPEGRAVPQTGAKTSHWPSLAHPRPWRPRSGG